MVQRIRRPVARAADLPPFPRTPVTEPCPSLVVFPLPEVVSEASEPPADRLLSGRPLQHTRNFYTDPEARLFAGEWSCEPGSWRVEYAEHEFCQLLEGEVLLRAADGRSWRLRAGDAFVIPAGFAGTWETLTRCRKHYVIFDPGV